jgi:hypothetical protein
LRFLYVCISQEVDPTIQAFTSKYLGQEGIVVGHRFGGARLVAGVKLEQYETHLEEAKGVSLDTSAHIFADPLWIRGLPINRQG